MRGEVAQTRLCNAVQHDALNGAGLFHRVAARDAACNRAGFAAADRHVVGSERAADRGFLAARVLGEQDE
jgi:hypothetical protein